jgi:hypothetical protein
LYDSAAGPLVRPYAMTRGRTRPRGESLDLISVVQGQDLATVNWFGLDPEHIDVLRLCQHPVPVADIASEINLPLGVVRVLLDDLRSRGLVAVTSPTSSTWMPDEQILRQVLDGLRAL